MESKREEKNFNIRELVSFGKKQRNSIYNT